MIAEANWEDFFFPFKFSGSFENRFKYTIGYCTAPLSFDDEHKATSLVVFLTVLLKKGCLNFNKKYFFIFLGVKTEREFVTS